MAKPQIPLVNKGLYYANGCEMTWLTTTTFSIAAGQLRDSTNTNDINMTSAVTVNGANVGVNGIDAGALANNTFYAVFAIGSSVSNDTTQLLANPQPAPVGVPYPFNPGQSVTPSTAGPFQPAQGLISTSATAPVLPAGYDMFRRIGYVLTDGAAHFLKFVQDGNNSQRWMWYDAPISVLAATAAAAFTAQSLAAAVPPKATLVTLLADLLPNIAAEFVALQPASSTNATGYYAKMSGSVAAVHTFGNLTVPCSLVAGVPNINWVTDAASTVALSVNAYLDLI